MPPEITQHLDPDETVIFSVNSKRQITKDSAQYGLLFSSLWLGVTFTIGYTILFEPFMTALSGGTSTFLKNGTAVTVGMNNLSELVFPAGLIGLFTAVGVGVLITTARSFFSSGGLFVGTNKRFLHLRKDKFRSINWNEFSGNLTTTGDSNNGDLVLELKINSTVYIKGMLKPRSTAGEPITIVGIQNVSEIERLCRTKIEEFKNQKPQG